MPARSLRPLAALLAGSLTSLATAQDEYSFTIEGAPVEHEMLLTADAPGARALADVGGWLLTLPAPGEYHLTRDDERLLWRAGEADILVALDFGRRRRGEDIAAEPVAELEDAVLAGLWGVAIRDWDHETAVFLRRLAPDTALKVWWSGLGDQTPPPIPQHITRLQLDGNMKNEDLDLIAPLDDLKYLAISGNGGVFDGTWAPPAARAVRLAGVDLRGSAHMPVNAELRRLELRGVRGVRSLEFVERAPAMEELTITWSDTEDLSPIGGHQGLRILDIAGCPAGTLPDQAVPNLRRARLLSTDATPRQLAAFRRLHPDATVLTSWKEALEAAAAGCDRIRVRSGGTCHRDRSSEQTLFEQAGAEAVSRLIDMIQTEHEGPGLSCRCCGEPTIELYRGDQLVLALGFHHGQLIRWHDGPWPGDAMLSQQSAEALVEWLAAEGVEGPRQELEESGQRDDAMGRRFLLYSRIMPMSVDRALREATTEEEAGAAFLTVEDENERAAVALRMFGCHYDSWRNNDPFAMLLVSHVLPRIEPAHLAAAVTAERDVAVSLGAARWLFWEGHWKDVPEEALRAMLPAAARAGAAHPDKVSRRHTIGELSRMEAPEAIEALRDVLHGRIRLARPTPDLLEEVAVSKTFRPSDKEIQEPEDDTVAAAVALARRQDVESLPRILELMEGAADEDRARLQAAARSLGWDG